MVIKASVLSSDIEAGDTTTGVDPIDKLDGSSIDFSGNDILATATGSTSQNTLKVDGVDINGSFDAGVAGDQDHTINTNAGQLEGHTRAFADVYLASLQFNEATVTASVGDVSGAGDIDDGDMNVLVEDVTGSSVLAGDADLADDVFDGNTIFSSARGNIITNAIDIDNVTTYGALTGLGSTQNTDGGNKQLASTNGDIVVSVATLDTSTGTITKSSVVADGNRIGSEAITNTGSNSISIDATTIAGPGIDPEESNEGFMTRAWHSNLVASASTDIALVSNQQVENSPVQSRNTGSFVVDAANVGGAIGAVTDSSVSLSGNSASALTVGNAVGENVIEVADAVTFAASVGLVSFQVVQDNAGPGGVAMSAIVEPSDDPIIDIAIVDLTSNAVTTTGSRFDVDGNAISAQVYGNLVAGNTNAIRIDAVTVGDNDMGTRTVGNTTADVDIGDIEAVVDRNIQSDDLPQTTVNSGFSLISDQSFEDPGINPVIASISSGGGDVIDVNIGSGDAAAVVESVDVSASENDITGRVNLNTSNNAIEIGQNSNVETLDANITLVNTQTFWDEFQEGDGAGRIAVDVNGDIDIDVEAGQTTIADVNVEANGNAFLAEARISKANNEIAVSAQTQVVTGLIAGDDVQSVNIGNDKSTVRSEIGLINDQDFNGLTSNGINAESGVAVQLDGTDIFVTVSTNDGSLIDSTAEADGNSLRAHALGNDAVNALSLDVGTVDLSDALIGGGAGNAPLAIISNAQRGSDADVLDAAGFWAEFDNSDIEVDLSSIDIDIENVHGSVDGNNLEALARVNNGRNVLDVSGGTYEPVADTTPLVQAQDLPGGGDVAAEDLAFGIASYQTNGYDVEAFGEDTELGVDVSGGVQIDSSQFSVSDNVMTIQARSNDNINDASVKFTTNNVSAFVANVQAPGSNEVRVAATGEDISLSVNGSDSDATDTNVDVDGNNVSVIGTVNRALLNTLSVDGTNLFSGTGSTTPSALVDPAGAIGDVSVVSDASVLNVQGEDVIGSGFDEVVDVYGDDIDFTANFDVFDSGSISVDNNLQLNQGIIHSANNLLGMGASYAYNEATGAVSLSATGNVANIAATGSIVSQQIVTDNSEVVVRGEDLDLEIDVNDISSTDAVALSVSNNDLVNQAIGGTVLNRMDVLAGVTITGVVATPTPEIGDLSLGNPLVANADFNIVNYQAGETEVYAAGEDTELSIEINSAADAVGDSLTVSGNELESRATGFNASNILVLNAKSSSDATANVLNRQDIANATVEAVQSDDLVNDPILLFIDANGSGAVDSSVTLDDNMVSSTASGNVALNAVSTTAGATLQESSGAGITIDPAGPVFVAPTNSDYSVLNAQNFTDASAVSETSELSIFIDGFSGATGVDNSAFSVSDNAVTAASTANRSENYLVLNTGTFQHPSATVGNLQSTSGATISATTANVTIGIGNGDNIAATSNNSSFTVRGNQIGATAIGNSTVGSITGN
jgi:hypothetical protein